MNKRCTNSSCRKTFSTLNYGGKCPFCGKVYPQLECARKDGLPAPMICAPNQPVWKEKGPFIRVFIQRKHADRKGRLAFDISLKDMLAFEQNGEKIKGIKALREEMIRGGYIPGLRESKDFFEAIMNNRHCSRWRVTDEGFKPVPGKTSRHDHSAKNRKTKTSEMEIDELDLSVRAYNCLKRAGIDTVADLIQLNKDELSGIRNLGKKSAEEILKKLHAMNLRLLGREKKDEKKKASPIGRMALDILEDPFDFDLSYDAVEDALELEDIDLEE